MYRILIYPFILLLSIIFGIYGGQYQVTIAFLLFYLIGVSCVKMFLKSEISIEVFNYFFFIYGLYLLATHSAFIINPKTDYFLHNDTVGSFYKGTLYTVDKSWSSIFISFFTGRFFSDYPFAQLLFTSLAKISIYFQIEDLRLFLRIQGLWFSCGIISIMAQFFKEYGCSSKEIYKNIFIFGLGSYLILTSSVFTRDVHVAFAYTLLSYLYFKKDVQYVYFKFVLVILLAYGFRPQNGLFALCFPFCYFMKDKINNPLAIIGCVCIVLSAVIAFDVVDVFIKTSTSYRVHTTLETQGGLFSILNSLPFPINALSITVYTLLLPTPFFMYIASPNIGWLGVLSIFMPFITYYTLSILFLSMKGDKETYLYKLFLCFAVLYLMITSFLEPSIRRVFAMLPSLYMVSCIKYNTIFFSVRKRMIQYVLLFILILNVITISYWAINK